MAIVKDEQGNPKPQYELRSTPNSFEPVKGINGGMDVNVVNAYDSADDMLKIKSMQRKFRDSFTGASVDAAKWDTVTGAGATLTVASGTLTMASGTTINSETYLLSKEVFTIPFRLSVGLTLSQRIANQTFYVEMISVNSSTLVPDGKHCAALIFDGTTATQAKYRVQNGAMTALDSGSSTVVTTAGTGVYEIEPYADECWFHSSTLDSTAGRVNSYRRHQQIPDPNALYKIRLRWLNAGTAPASSTNAVLQFLAVQDYAELTAEITAGRGNGVAGQGIYATVAGTVTATSTSGVAAHDAAVSGNPIRVAGKAISSLPTAVATGDVHDVITTLHGAVITKPYAIPEGDWSFACTAPVANTTDVVLKAAGAAGIRNYLTGLQVKNTNAVATEIVLKDGSTVIWRGHVNATMNQTEDIQFPSPLKGTAATALNFACITTGANVYVNAQGYQAV